MVDNPTKIYNDYVRANLPNSMSYDTGTDRYDINNHSFFKFKNSNWYYNYISKYGYSALTAYAVNGLEPALVFDFKGNYFRKIATASTFGASITHAATTNATMVDSDGLLKWRPHNRVTSSGDLASTSWSAIRATYDGPTETLTQVGTTINGIVTQAAASLTVGARYKYTIRMKAGNTGWGVVGHVMTSASWVKTWFDLSNGVVGTVGANTTATIVNAGDGWWDCSVEAVASSGGGNISAQIATSDGAVNAVDGDTLLVRQVHAFRSDLGGMVNNPDTGDSYVPTTTTPVYLSRRGHHIYNGDAWVNEGILHESQARTNLLTYSNDFANAAWSKTNMTVTANQATGPDGTVSAAEISLTGGGYCINSAAITTGTLSYFAKQNTERFLVIVRGVYGAGDWAIFDLSNGTVSKSPTHNNSTAHMVPMGNGWYRCVLQSAQSAAVNAFSISGSGTNNSVATSGTVYLYGAQLELGATPSSYIPTTTATATRTAETLTVPAANLPYDSTNMSIQMDGKMTYADRGVTINVQPYRWQLSNSNYIDTRLTTSGSRTGQPVFAQRDGTSGYDTSEGANNAYSPDTNVPFNIASRHGSTFINGAHEGTLLTADTTPTILPDLSATDLQLGNAFMGTIGEFRMWSDDLGDAGITEATLPSTEPSLSLTFDGSENSFIVLDWSE